MNDAQILLLTVIKRFTGYVQGRFPDDEELQQQRAAADKAVDTPLAASQEKKDAE